MYFSDIIGQDDAKRRLVDEAKHARTPHARLFCGQSGTGKLPLAIAYARYLCCSNPTEHDACGHCPNCVKFDKLAHPDLHFVFPVVKKKGKDTVSDDYLNEWREMLARSPYFALEHWLQQMGAENQQAQIYVSETDAILRKLSLKASQGGWKVMIVWLPEKMNTECSNKLLKLLEEPPPHTAFMLVSEEPDTLLETIRSRTQRFPLHGIDDDTMAGWLRTRFGVEKNEAEDIARMSGGSCLKAMQTIHLNEENTQFLEWFIALMRLSYQRKIREMKQWSETLAGIGRERQKQFLLYCQRMIRENFVCNFHDPSLNYLNAEERNFASRFAPFVNERNVIGIMDELSEAQRHIEQNVNPKMVFFDFALKMIVLLVQKT